MEPAEAPLVLGLVPNISSRAAEPATTQGSADPVVARKLARVAKALMMSEQMRPPEAQQSQRTKRKIWRAFVIPCDTEHLLHDENCIKSNIRVWLMLMRETERKREDSKLR
jgi:hypothetical protein